MNTKLRIVLAQLNLTVGDIQGNVNKLMAAAINARDSLQADVIVFPELSITGYPPEDLLFRNSFLEESAKALQQFTQTIEDIYCVVGHPDATDNGLFNACSLIYNKAVLGTYHKQHLPNYGVFDEARYFNGGTKPCVIPIKGIPVGITICEDLWYDQPIFQARKAGARLILSPNASPFESRKHEQRQLTLAKRIKETDLPIVYVNCVGGQDELVFDGGSMVVDHTGNICQHAGFFKENFLLVEFDFTNDKVQIPCQAFTVPTATQRIYDALVLGTRDYIIKNKFKGALLGVSGGIDSALTLAIAVDALGNDAVTAVMMPSRYSADISKIDALELINNLSVKYEEISIEPPFSQFLEILNPILKSKKINTLNNNTIITKNSTDLTGNTNITEENLQSRCRGNILMALSNNTGHIVLTTGNRSELAVGYTTLYGDMAGGFNVLKDIPKTLVYELSSYRNQISAIIPERTIKRAPTAELAPNQKDEDSLPPYPILDQILQLYLDESYGLDEIVKKGFDYDTVRHVINLIHRNEYKRKQTPVGVRINHKSFGKDWRYPITSGFND